MKPQAADPARLQRRVRRDRRERERERFAMQEAERFEDMSPRGRLRVLQQDDGDIIVCVVEDPSSHNGGTIADVEFCTSGGKSPKTLAALQALMQAMAEDNADRPYCSRRGERGLGVDDLTPNASAQARP